MVKLETVKSPLVQAVLTLDENLASLERIGEKITSLRLKSETDQEQMRKLLSHFATYGQGITDEVSNLSAHLIEARARAEAVATEVAKRAEELNGLSGAQQGVWNRFGSLNEKVQELNKNISALKKPADDQYTDEDRAQLGSSLREFDSLFEPLIEEAESIRAESHALKIKTLEQNADSLAQTLKAIREKIRVVTS